MNEYPISANISKIEARIIDKLRRVQRLGWGGLEIKVSSNRVVQLRSFDDDERNELIDLQK